MFASAHMPEFGIVIYKALYPYILIVANKLGVHFHPLGMAGTRGILYLFNPTLYNDTQPFAIRVFISVLSRKDFHRFSPLFHHTSLYEATTIYSYSGF